jgi:hypothetical protein
MRACTASMRGGVKALSSMAICKAFVPVHGTKTAMAKSHYQKVGDRTRFSVYAMTVRARTYLGPRMQVMGAAFILWGSGVGVLGS